MRIVERLKTGAPCFSFEFFPPKTDDGVSQLFQTLHDLVDLEPGFVSVTYGAGGSTQRLTLELVSRIKRETGIEAMAHLTCASHGRTELLDILRRLEKAGLENVLALRGDPPRDQPTFIRPADGFSYASEFTAFIRQHQLPFCIGGACHPEGHLESPSRDDDLRNLKRKVDSGAEFLISQLFYDNAFFFHFLERARSAGITCPIVPGIMPLTNFDQIDRITRMCGATVPMRLRLAMERVRDQPDAILQLGVAHATVQCVELLAAGVPGIHFYTLNRSRASRMILTALKLGSATSAAQ
jgi:methylenetetrahydrofolate reductase (NADPH)